jgi:hypothetical protein
MKQSSKEARISMKVYYMIAKLISVTNIDINVANDYINTLLKLTSSILSIAELILTAGRFCTC